MSEPGYKAAHLVGLGDYGKVWVRVELHTHEWGKELSIQGVEGPKSNGDAEGYCGQIVDTVAGCAPIEPFTVELRDRLADVWRRWHHNGMRAGCEHQRANWGDLAERVEIVEYGLTSDAYREMQHLQKVAAQDAVRGEVRQWTPVQRALLELSVDGWYRHRNSPPDADSPLSGCYEVRKREQRPRCQVYEREHPRGLLSKPCEVCGYKYGTKWLHEQLPDDVVEFVRSLPVDTSCPWGTYA